MRVPHAAALLTGAVLLIGGCSGGQDEAAETDSPAASAPAEAASAETPSASAPASPGAVASDPAPTATTEPAVVPPPAETGGPAPTELVGVPVAAPEGYAVVALPEAFASQLAELTRQSGQQVAALEAAGITDSAGNEAAVVLVTQYSGIDVTTPEFAEQRRAQAQTQGATLAEEEIAGTPMLTSASPPLVSWTQGQDTLVVVSSAGAMALEDLRGVAAAMLAAS